MTDLGGADRGSQRGGVPVQGQMGSPLGQRAADFRGADWGSQRGVPVQGQMGSPLGQEQRILEGRIGVPEGGPCAGANGVSHRTKSSGF